MTFCGRGEFSGLVIAGVYWSLCATTQNSNGIRAQGLESESTLHGKLQPMMLGALDTSPRTASIAMTQFNCSLLVIHSLCCSQFFCVFFLLSQRFTCNFLRAGFPLINREAKSDGKLTNNEYWCIVLQSKTMFRAARNKRLLFEPRFPFTSDFLERASSSERSCAQSTTSCRFVVVLQT